MLILFLWCIGNEVHISVCTETEYEKRESANHFGLKCQVVGYEWTTVPTEVHARKWSFYEVFWCEN